MSNIMINEQEINEQERESNAIMNGLYTPGLFDIRVRLAVLCEGSNRHLILSLPYNFYGGGA